MTEAIGRRLGASIGDVEDIDMPDGRVLGGKFLRVKVRLDLSRPLQPHVYLQRKKEGLKRIEVRYERLPTFCFYCGVLGHDLKYCVANLQPARHPPRG